MEDCSSAEWLARDTELNLCFSSLIRLVAVEELSDLKNYGAVPPLSDTPQWHSA
jgi:hypothetical protein